MFGDKLLLYQKYLKDYVTTCGYFLCLSLFIFLWWIRILTILILFVFSLGLDFIVHFLMDGGDLKGGSSDMSFEPGADPDCAHLCRKQLRNHKPR